MTDRAALLAAIKADPADDSPRLIFADWLEENGEAERAEFVRVQIELAKRNRRLIETVEVWQGKRWLCRCGPQPCGPCIELQRQEIELLNRNEVCWLRQIGVIGDYKLPPGRFVRNGEFTFSRGFIARVRCTAADCVAHLDAIRAEHPVEAVELTTRPTLVSSGGRVSLEGRSTSGEPASVFIANEADWLRHHLLSSCWPGVKFTFPPPERTRVLWNHDPNASLLVPLHARRLVSQFHWPQELLDDANIASDTIDAMLDM